MYLDYFGLKERPFSIAPDPRYLYMSERHREALAHLLFGVSGQGGFVLLTGEVGTGKTTTCRCFLEQVPENTDVAFIVNPKLSARELMASICDELDIEYPEASSIKKLNDLINEYLLSAHAVCRHTVLIIDEAQNLSVDVLEQLRLLTNLETTEKKLLQVVLLGQPELRDMLEKTELRQLSQRITARYHLKELDKQETHAYVKARLTIAGCKGVLFSKSALNRLHRKSHGVPRLINLIADRALLGAYATQSDVVGPEHINQACKEVLGDRYRLRIPALPKFSQLWLPLLLAIGVTSSTYVVSQNYEEYKMALLDSHFYKELHIFLTAPDESQSINDNASLTMVSEIESLSEEEASESDDANQKVVTTPVNTKAVGEFINNDPFLEATSTRFGRYLAFKSLFQRWQRDYPQEPLILACRFAEQNGLKCLHKQGNWRSLININRPAVLELINAQGDAFYISLLSVENDLAEVAYLGERLEVPISLIDQYWLGQYSIIWKLPPYKSNLITPESKLSENEWLSLKLAQLNLYEGDEALIEPLKARIKRFQSSLGLEPDGIAGSRTLIELNSRIDLDVPKLKPVYLTAASSSSSSSIHTITE